MNGPAAVRAGALLAALLPWLAALAGEPAAVAPVCVNSRAELKAHDLVDIFLRQKGRLELKDAAGCLKLDNGPQLPALLLALPPFEQPYAIRLAAPTQGNSYLEPHIDMLDAQYQPLRSFGAERLKRRGTEMSLEIFMNEPNAAERFVLIYADPGHLGDKDQKTTSESQMFFLGTGFLSLGNDKTVSLSSTTQGALMVQLIGEQWDKALHAAQNRSR